VASLRAGFTREEAESLADQAGLGYVHYNGNFLAQRFTVAGIKRESAREDPALRKPTQRNAAAQTTKLEPVR
jgi:hypothetical protein